MSDLWFLDGSNDGRLFVVCSSLNWFVELCQKISLPVASFVTTKVVACCTFVLPKLKFWSSLGSSGGVFFYKRLMGYFIIRLNKLKTDKSGKERSFLPNR